MLLGTLTLTRREVDTFTRATLLRAYNSSTEPARSLCLLAALGLSVQGPPDWPTMRAGLDYAGYGSLVRAYLTIRAVDMRSALALGMMAVAAVSREPGITDAEAEEYAAFFGIAPTGAADAPSPSDTKDPPSGA